MTTRLLGVYIDFVGAESLAGTRLVLLEQHRENGPVVLRSAGDGSTQVVAAMSRVSCEELALIMASLYGSQQDQMAS